MNALVVLVLAIAIAFYVVSFIERAKRERRVNLSARILAEALNLDLNEIPAPDYVSPSFMEDYYGRLQVNWFYLHQQVQRDYERYLGEELSIRQRVAVHRRYVHYRKFQMAMQIYRVPWIENIPDK